jgi:hypothetical protein
MSLNRRMNSIEKRLQTPHNGPHVFVGYTEGPPMPGRSSELVDTSDATAKDGRYRIDGKWLNADELARRGIRPITVTFPDRVPLPDGKQPAPATRN